MSNWIGPAFATAWAKDGKAGEGIPQMRGEPGGRGINVQNETIARNGMPHIHYEPGGRGISAQKVALDGMPHFSQFIGGRGVSAQRATPDIVPHFDAKGGGRGVNQQRTPEKVPNMGDTPGGRGINAQKKTPDWIPFTSSEGQGVMAGRNGDVKCLSGERLLPTFLKLADRLKKVVVLRRDWSSCLSDTLTMKQAGLKVGVFLDPPYVTNGTKDYYGGDTDDPAIASYKWAVENGNDKRFRIAYACREDDFPVPDGWTSELQALRGVRDVVKRKERLDMVMFSPHCGVPVVQQGLF